MILGGKVIHARIRGECDEGEEGFSRGSRWSRDRRFT